MEMENQPQNPEFRNDPEYFLIIISSSTLKQAHPKIFFLLPQMINMILSSI